jgi:hypothetical protein
LGHTLLYDTFIFFSVWLLVLALLVLVLVLVLVLQGSLCLVTPLPAAVSCCDHGSRLQRAGDRFTHRTLGAPRVAHCATLSAVMMTALRECAPCRDSQL